MLGDRNITLWDLNLHRLSREEFKKKLLETDMKPDIIGIGGIVTVLDNFLWMSKICKEIFPESLLVAGGSLGSTVPRLLFKHSPVDICANGEGEFSLSEIIKNYENGVDKQDMQHINGLFLWDEQKDILIQTPTRPRTPNLDVFGIPAYDLIDVEQYAANGILNLKGYVEDLPTHIFSSENLHLPIMTSRGCTARCTFCYRQFPKIEMNSTEYVKNHIWFLYNQYGINIFSIADELFNISEKRTDEMCSCLMQVKQKIPEFYFRVAGRADVIDIEILKKLKEAGCFQMIYGLESGSPKVLKMMKKRVTVEQNRKAMLAARDAGIHSVPQFIIGLPGENRDTLLETIEFIKSIDFWSYLSIHKANAYPGSEIYINAKENGLIQDELEYVSSLGDTDQYPLQLADISLKEMRKILKWFLIKRKIKLVFKNHNYLAAIFILMIWVIKNTLRILANKIGEI